MINQAEIRLHALDKLLSLFITNTDSDPQILRLRLLELFAITPG